MQPTTRQKNIMALVIAGDALGWLDIDTLMEELATRCDVHSKQSIQCSIRKLEAHGVLTRGYQTRRGKNRMILIPTGKGLSIFRKGPKAP